jgi:hypothetical protein
MMKKISTYVVGLAGFAAAATIVFKLFPLGGHLGGRKKVFYSLPLRTEPYAMLIERLSILLVTAVIATVVVWVFKRVRGEISVNASLPGGIKLEFSGAQTQITMWGLVFTVINLVN